MPLPVLTQEERETGFARLAPPFRLLLAEQGVPQDVQEVLGHFGFTTFEIYAKLDGDEQSVRRWLKAADGLGLDGAGTDTRVVISALLVAWDASRDRISRRSAMEAEQRAAGRAPGLLRGDILAVRRAYEKIKGEQRDEDAPGKGYLELKLEEFHDGELVAEHLSEVTSVSEEKKAPAQSGSVDLRWDNVLQLRTGRHTVAVPRSPEELRYRIRLMRTLWSYLKLKGVAPQLLSAYDGAIWDEYVEFVLGPQGWALQSMDANGQVVASPTWKGILHWEHELRKEAVKRINRGAGFEPALKAAMKDSELRMRYLLQPIALTAAAEAVTRAGGGGHHLPAGAETGFEPAAKRFKGDGGKGAGKDKGKGAGRGKGGGPAPPLPQHDGAKKEFAAKFRKQREKHPATLRLSQGDKRVCYDYQGKNGCKKAACTYLHICAYCGESGHGYEKPCPKLPSQ